MLGTVWNWTLLPLVSSVAHRQGGVGKVIGAVVGAFLIGVLNNGMSIMGVGIDWQKVVKGVVLLLAVLFDVYNKNKNA